MLTQIGLVTCGDIYIVHAITILTFGHLYYDFLTNFFSFFHIPEAYRRWSGPMDEEANLGGGAAKFLNFSS